MEDALCKQPFHTCHYLRNGRSGVQVEARVHVQGQSLHLCERNWSIDICIMAVVRVAETHLAA